MPHTQTLNNTRYKQGQQTIHVTKIETTNYKHDTYIDNKLYTGQIQRQQTIHRTNTETTNYTHASYTDIEQYTI